MTEPTDPACPVQELNTDGSPYNLCIGLTAREHAAIALRVPDSGEDWLNAMILKSLQQEFAKAAMTAITPEYERTGHPCPLMESAVMRADALVAELLVKAPR